MKNTLGLLALLVLVSAAMFSQDRPVAPPAAPASLIFPGEEKFLANVIGRLAGR